MADENSKTSESQPETKTASETSSDTSQTSIDSNSKSATDSKTKTPKPKKTRRKGGGFFKFLIVLILLAGLGGGGWYLYKFVESEFGARDQRLAVAGQQVSQLAQQLSVTQQNQQNIERTLANFIGDQQRQMQSLAERVRTTEGARDGDWVLAEAQYLLRLADQRLLISRDTESAAELLGAADELLRELAYPELVAVREALISDIAMLQAAPSVDYQGLYFQILAAGRGIDSLQLQSIEASAGSEEAGSANGSQGIWSLFVSTIKSTLSQLVVVRKTTDSAEWLVDAEGEAALRGQLDLLILQSLSALLSGDQTIYSSALNSAASLVSANFEESSQRQSVESSLLGFAEEQILAEIPDISGSLRAMEYGAELLRRIDQGD
jgi:uroporphyrin-III C-methyltransferase